MQVETGLLRKWFIHEMQANPDKLNTSNNQHCQTWYDNDSFKKKWAYLIFKNA